MEAHKGLKPLDFTVHFPPEIIMAILDFVGFEDISGFLAVNKQWHSFASRFIVDYICDDYFAEKVSSEHVRINITLADDLEHTETILNYRLHHLSIFTKLELRIDHGYIRLIDDWPEHIRQLATLKNLINLEFETVPDIFDEVNWNALSVLTNLQRLVVDNSRNNISGDWMPSSLHSLQLRCATLDPTLEETIGRMSDLSELILDYTVAADYLLDSLFKRIGSRLTKLVFRDRIAEEFFQIEDDEEELKRQGPSSWQNFTMLTNLETLRLSSPPKDGLECISNLTQLTSFALLGSNEEINSYRSLSNFTNLRSIMINPIAGTLVPLLQAMTQLTDLEELAVTNCHKMKDEDLMGLTIFPKLTRLDLASTPELTKNSFEFLLKLTSLQQVKLKNGRVWQEYEHKSKIPFEVTIGEDYYAFTS